MSVEHGVPPLTNPEPNKRILTPVMSPNTIQSRVEDVSATKWFSCVSDEEYESSIFKAWTRWMKPVQAPEPR